jgi:hypothetical protein
MIENPKDGDPNDAPPIAVQSCFDRLEITINNPLLTTMLSHLAHREDDRNSQVDTDFDVWIHRQIFQPEFNTL